MKLITNSNVMIYSGNWINRSLFDICGANKFSFTFIGVILSALDLCKKQNS